LADIDILDVLNGHYLHMADEQSEREICLFGCVRKQYICNFPNFQNRFIAEYMKSIFKKRCNPLDYALPDDSSEIIDVHQHAV